MASTNTHLGNSKRKMPGTMDIEKKTRMFLIDGMALAYRSYFAFVRNPLINSKGENVSAVYGFTNTLLSILDNEEPDLFAVIFDTPEPTFRHELFPEYKAQRAEMPDDMVEQLPRLYEMLEILNIPSITKPGFEADDIIGTLAKVASKAKILTIIVSGDKDMMQLVNPYTKIMNPKKSGQDTEWLDEKGVLNKVGLPPEKIIDYLALMGDSSDNIPGVPGIGPKSALSLLQKYDTVEHVLENIDQIEEKRSRIALEKNPELAKISKELTTIHCDVPLDFSLDTLKPGDIDNSKAFEFFQKLEFRSLADRFSPEKYQPGVHYELVDSNDSFEKLILLLNDCRDFTFDTETTSPDPMRAELVGLSFSMEKTKAYYIPVKGPVELTSSIQPLNRNFVLSQLKPILENPNIPKCAHNGKYDVIVLSHYGIHVKGFVFDTMIASYLLDPSKRQHNLDALSLDQLNLKKIPTTSLIGSGTKQITMDMVPIDKVSEYACEDADVTYRLWKTLAPQISESNLEKLMEEVEIPLVSVLVKMEKNGVALDEKYLAKMSKQLETELYQLEVKIYDLAGTKFNINSTKQLGKILFDDLKLPIIRKTKTGYSTDVSVLEELAKEHDLPMQILEFRQLAKLKSTYVDALPRLVNPKTHRLHTSYNQTVAATGRLSSSDPNLQNIPIRTEIGKKIRAAFIPSNDSFVILDADYSQIELRIMAHLSGDRTLKSAFEKNEDIHTRTAALVFNVEAENVTADQRRKAKEVNFGIMYGMGAFGLSQRLGITPDEAAQFIEAYFVSYPKVQQFMNDVVRQARENYYVTTLLNRRRYLQEINADNRRVRDFAERTAINTPIQGSAADLIKVAMIKIHNRIEREVLRSKMILQVHDELVFDVPFDELDYMKKLVVSEMENAIQLSVPIKVDIGYGHNWLEAH